MTARVVLLGSGIGYSASPAMHNAAFAALGLDWGYELRDVAAEVLPDVLAELRDGTLAGANVTQPHKAAVIPLLDGLSEAAERVGAVNTIVRAPDGTLRGENTDLPALAEELAELAQLGRFRRAVVLGRGGAARTAGAALDDAGASVMLIGRDHWSVIPELLRGADLLVNATPIGTLDDASPVPASLLRRDLAVLDLVYRPSPTRLVREALAAGAAATTGAGVLLRQAARSLELWTGASAPLDVMREALQAELGAAVNA
jgi:shikimate dehydrogenase